MAWSFLLLVPLFSVGFSSVGSVPGDPAADAGLSEGFRDLPALHDLSGDALLDAFFERLLASKDPGTAKLVEGIQSGSSPVVKTPLPIPSQVDFIDRECGEDVLKERRAGFLSLSEGQGRDSDHGGPGGCQEASGGCGPEVLCSLFVRCLLWLYCESLLVDGCF